MTLTINIKRIWKPTVAQNQWRSLVLPNPARRRSSQIKTCVFMLGFRWWAVKRMANVQDSRYRAREGGEGRRLSQDDYKDTQSGKAKMNSKGAPRQLGGAGTGATARPQGFPEWVKFAAQELRGLMGEINLLPAWVVGTSWIFKKFFWCSWGHSGRSQFWVHAWQGARQLIRKIFSVK